MSSLIEQAAKRLEELRRAGVDVDDAPLVAEAPTIKRTPTPEAMVRALETRTAHANSANVWVRRHEGEATGGPAAVAPARM